ncbi:MAG: class I SAM-dependent methyltransferase [Nanoarchaeota archaeon]|nr:class I SAM-dependent methyltransferase [Nanoarchaeota archaeon]
MGEEILESYLRFARTRQIIDKVPEGVIVDIGCGNGQFLRKVSKKATKCIGFDDVCELKKGKIEIRKKRLEKQIDLDDESVDCVTMIACLEHLDWPIELLKESYRILKKGGVLLITSPSPKSKKLLEFLSYKLKIVSPKQIEDHKNYFNKSELKEILIKQCKFKKVTVKTFQLGLNNAVVAYK